MTAFGRQFVNITGFDINCLPPLLKIFITEIINFPFKQAAIGQCVVQAARPQGCIMPLLFGVRVDLDICGVQDLHIKLSRLGFAVTVAVTVDELRRYTNSVMQSNTDIEDADKGTEPMLKNSPDIKSNQINVYWVW